MSTIPLKIILHGLIALMPTFDNGMHGMTALVVDGRAPHDIEGKCEIKHHPILKFLVVKTKECTDAGCALSDFQCTCKEQQLEGRNISLTIEPEPEPASQRPNNERPTDDIPLTPEAAGDPAYLANLAQPPFNLTFNTAYLGASPPAHLLARMNVPFQTLTACLLSAREDTGQDNVYTMSFRKLHEPSRASESNQALAQMAIAELEIPASSSPRVVLKIEKIAGDPETRLIELRAGGKGYKIELSNQPDLPLDRDDPCNTLVARHFAMFYELAENPPQEKDRLLPHFRLDRRTERLSITPDRCKAPGFGLMDRPACPMAIFNP